MGVSVLNVEALQKLTVIWHSMVPKYRPTDLSVNREYPAGHE